MHLITQSIDGNLIGVKSVLTKEPFLSFSPIAVHVLAVKQVIDVRHRYTVLQIVISLISVHVYIT